MKNQVFLAFLRENLTDSFKIGLVLLQFFGADSDLTASDLECKHAELRTNTLKSEVHTE